MPSFTKKDYSNAVAAHGLALVSWLSVLPCYGSDGKPIALTVPVPIVRVPLNSEPPSGFRYRWSTTFDIDPPGFMTRALVHIH